MKFQMAITACVLSLSGCGPFVEVVKTTPRMVEIYSNTYKGAIEAAETECLKMGRHARLNKTSDYIFIFDCIQ